MAPLVSWIPKLNSKVFFTSKDQFDAMVTAVTKDKMLKPNHKGFRRAVRILLFILQFPSSSFNLFPSHFQSRLQIYRVFFAHLTTSIADIQLYLFKHESLRKLTVNFKQFKVIMDRLSAERDSAKSREVSSSAKKGSKRSTSMPSKGHPSDAFDALRMDDDDNINQSNLVGNNAASGSNDATLLLRKLNVTEREFFIDWVDNLHHMKEFPFNLKEHRVSPRLQDRLLTLGGLIWNVDSQSTNRDWSNIASAAAIEALIIRSYRPALLQFDNSKGACALRTSLLDLLKINSTCVSRTNALGKGIFHPEWFFADSMEIGQFSSPPHSNHNENPRPSPRAIEVIDIDADDLVDDSKASNPTTPSLVAPAPPSKTHDKPKPHTFDPIALSRALASAHSADGSLEKFLSPPIPFLHVIQYLEKHPLLACSDPSAQPGTIESLAHYCITTLYEVRRSSTSYIIFYPSTFTFPVLSHFAHNPFLR